MTMGAVWFLPVAALLPPVYALITPAPFVALDHWHQDSHVYQRVFSAAALGLAYGAVSELAHGAAPLAAGHAIPPGVTLVRIPRLGVPGTTVKTHSISAFPQLKVSIRTCGPRTFGLTRRQIANGGMDPFSGPEEAQ
jgi:hypothetical protein